MTACSVPVRGVWFEILLSMTLMQSDGVITGTREELARHGRCQLAHVDQLLDEFKRHRTADVSERNGTVTLVNRRMKREAKARQTGRSRVDRHRARPGCNAPVTPEPPPPLKDGKPESHQDHKAYKPFKGGGPGEGNPPAHPGSAGILPARRPRSYTLTPEENQLAQFCESLLGPQWPNDKGKWLNRIHGHCDRGIRANPAKVRRCFDDLRIALADGTLKKSPAELAENNWKEFHD